MVLVAIAVAAAAAQVIGGIKAKAAARARGKYFAGLQMEQANAANYFLKRKIAGETGVATQAAGSQGVAISGSSVEMILNENFNAQVQRTIQRQQALQQAEQTRISGVTTGSNALQQGVGGALTTSYDAAKQFRGSSKS